jgi:membrane protein
MYTLFSFLGDFSSRHLFLLCAGIAYTTLLCIFPLLLVAIFCAGLFIEPSGFLPALREMLQNILPPGPAGREIAIGFTGQIQLLFQYSSGAGWIGIPSLIWSASALLSSLRSGMAAVFGKQPPHSFLKLKIIDLAQTLLFIFLLMCTTILPLAAAAMQTFLHRWAGVQGPAFVLRLAGFAAPPILFIFIYTFLPPIKPGRSFILLATILACILWEAARYLFSMLTEYIPGLGSFYGAYAALAMPAIWVYYTAVIILLCADIARRLMHKQT